MIELAGLIYTLAKDLGKWIAMEEQEKRVDREWLEISGFAQRASGPQREGITLSWSRPEKVESRRHQGYETMYEVDRLRRIRYRIVRKSHDEDEGVVLMGKRE